MPTKQECLERLYQAESLLAIALATVTTDLTTWLALNMLGDVARLGLVALDGWTVMDRHRGSIADADLTDAETARVACALCVIGLLPPEIRPEAGPSDTQPPETGGAS